MMKRIMALCLVLLMAFAPALATRVSDRAEPYLSENAAGVRAGRGETLRYELADLIAGTSDGVLLSAEALAEDRAGERLWLTPAGDVCLGADGAVRILVFPCPEDREEYRERLLSRLDPDEFMDVTNVEETEEGTIVEGVVDDPELVYDMLAGHEDLFRPGDTLAERCLFDREGKLTEILRTVLHPDGETLPLLRVTVSPGAFGEGDGLPAVPEGDAVHTLTWILDPGTQEERRVTCTAKAGWGFLPVTTEAYEAVFLDPEGTRPAGDLSLTEDAVIYASSAWEDFEDLEAEGLEEGP